MNKIFKKLLAILITPCFCIIGFSGCNKEDGSVVDNGIELFGDTNFTSFGIAESLGQEWSKETLTHKGRITKTRIINKQINILPLGKATKEDNCTVIDEAVNTHWDFIEGEKKQIRDEHGVLLSELHDFRLNVSASVKENTESNLVIEQYNDYLHETYPNTYTTSNPKLVKRITSDKKGKITLYYNSYNDISNAAYNHSATFANNTWPHLYLNQNFHEPVAIEEYSSLDYKVTVKVNKCNLVNNWPMGESDRYDQLTIPTGPRALTADFQGYFLIREKSGTGCLFIGINYWSSNMDTDQKECFTNEQHGIPFYRIGLAEDECRYYNLVAHRIGINEEVNVSVDVLKLFGYVFDRKLKVNEKYYGGGLNSYYGKSIDDYVIADFHIGWENMGNWDCEAEISNISLKGVKK